MPFNSVLTRLHDTVKRYATTPKKFETSQTGTPFDCIIFIVLLEPAVGGGIMVLCFVEAMRAAGFNPSKELVVYAGDIDMRCACMSYLHFSLYGLPAVIDYGNTLTLDYWQRWYSPVYVFDLWTFRDKMRRRKGGGRDGTVDGTADRGRTDADAVRAGNPPQKEKAAGSGAFDEVQQLSLFDMS